MTRGVTFIGLDTNGTTVLVDPNDGTGIISVDEFRRLVAQRDAAVRRIRSSVPRIRMGKARA